MAGSVTVASSEQQGQAAGRQDKASLACWGSKRHLIRHSCSLGSRWSLLGWRQEAWSGDTAEPGEGQQLPLCHQPSAVS